MTPARGTAKRAPPKKRVPAKAAVEYAPLELHYSLAELPSAQHRAGLAGLVLMVRWLDRLPGRENGICKLKACDDRGATLEVDREGMQRLFNELYDATEELQESAQIRKDKKGQEVPHSGVVEREVQEPGGKVRRKTLYLYPATVPRGGLLLDRDPTAEGSAGLWIKLWRDMMWNTLRAVPATRASFDERARGEDASGAAEVWETLRGEPERSLELPSSYYIGAMASTADNVPIRDRARFQLLLHFWPYAAQVYVPARYEVEEGRSRADFNGYALAVPDVAVLGEFCDALQEALRRRRPDKLAYRPREAVVDLPVEGALDLAHLLQERIGKLEGARETGELVLGFEVFHLSREGNNVRLVSARRIEPTRQMMARYAAIRENLYDPLFRRQRLLNLVHGREWYEGFDALIQTHSYKTHTIGSGLFCRDARMTFEKERGVSMEKEKVTAPDAGIEQLVYRFVRDYVLKRVEAKTQLRWPDVKGDPRKEEEYGRARGRVATDAFLAVRSRTGADFISYFAGTLCSVPHRLGEEQFQFLARELQGNTDKTRTLILLALSAWNQSASQGKQDKQDTEET